MSKKIKEKLEIIEKKIRLKERCNNILTRLSEGHFSKEDLTNAKVIRNKVEFLKGGIEDIKNLDDLNEIEKSLNKIEDEELLKKEKERVKEEAEMKRIEREEEMKKEIKRRVNWENGGQVADWKLEEWFQRELRGKWKNDVKEMYEYYKSNERPCPILID